MTEKLREQISALADDELPVGEHELLARRFAAEKHLCICWERYHLIGEAMRKDLPDVDTRGFVDRIMAVLGQEAALSQEHSVKKFGYFGKTAIGMALAASVAVVAILGLRHEGVHLQSASAPAEIVPQETAIQATPVSYGMVSNANWNGNTPEVQAELNNYIINHNEITAALGQQGLLPYFYITTYPARGQISKSLRTPQAPGPRNRP